MYILDNRYIRKIDTQGLMTVIAGDGTFNSAILNEGGLAVGTPLSYPRGIAIGPDGSDTSYGLPKKRGRCVNPSSCFLFSDELFNRPILEQKT